MLVLANKLLHFVPLTDSFIILDAKLLKPQSLMWKETAYRACLLSGLSRNRPLGPCALWKLLCCLKLVVNSCSGQIIWFEKIFPTKVISRTLTRAQMYRFFKKKTSHCYGNTVVKAVGFFLTIVAKLGWEPNFASGQCKMQTVDYCF